MKRKCEACQKDPGSSAFCQWCGSSAVVAVEEDDGKPARGSNVRVVSADEVDDTDPLIPCKAPIFACVGGYGTGTVVSVSAPPGGGKTTEVLRVAIAQDARVLHLVCGESTEKQARDAALDAGATPKFFREKKQMIVTGDDWRDAMEYAERVCAGRSPPSFIIWDSTTNWVPPKEEEEKEFVAQNVELATDYDLVVFAICQWSQQGRARGTLSIAHGGALCIKIKPSQFDVTKARPPWSGKQGSYPRPFLKPGQTWPDQEVAARRKK